MKLKLSTFVCNPDSRNCQTETPKGKIQSQKGLNAILKRIATIFKSRNSLKPSKSIPFSFACQTLFFGSNTPVSRISSSTKNVNEKVLRLFFQ